MRFNNAFELDEAEVLAGRFRDQPDKLSGKYVSAWHNFGVNLDSRN